MSLLNDLQSPPETDECLIFRGGYSSKGFGVIGYEKRPVYAHAVAYQFSRLMEPVQNGILQTCGVLRCYNPLHLLQSPEPFKVIENHLLLTLPDAAVMDIYRDERKQKVIAEEYWIKPLMVRRIKHNNNFKHLPRHTDDIKDDLAEGPNTAIMGTMSAQPTQKLAQTSIFPETERTTTPNKEKSSGLARGSHG